MTDDADRFVDDRGPEGRHTHAEDAGGYEDGQFTGCPISGCAGDLWYPSTPLGDAVVCEDCDRHFAHYYSSKGVNQLLDPSGSGEVLATVYDSSNDDRLVTDGGTDTSDRYRYLRPIDEHPIPFDQEEIDAVWRRRAELEEADAPGVDEAHEDYVETIAERGEWNVFRPRFPFGHGDVTFWNSATGEAFRINDEEGSWHTLVNLFAEVVDEEGDCRDADYSGGTTQSGGHRQRCKECGGSWVIG